jgi:pimeloyl-ACP methyl ester carboxylesterase
MDMMAEDCHALLDHLNITSPVVLCGLSMGGYITLAFYRNFPSRVAALILAATRANADSPESRENRDKAIQLANQQGSIAIAASMLPKMFASNAYDTNLSLITNVKDMMAHTSVEGITGALHGMKNRPDSYSMLQFIQAPTLVIHGADDQLIPLSIAQDMAAAIPGAILSIIPRAGHLLNLEQPELFNQAVRDFILEQVQA